MIRMSRRISFFMISSSLFGGLTSGSKGVEIPVLMKATTLDSLVDNFPNRNGSHCFVHLPSLKIVTSQLQSSSQAF